MTTCSCCKGEQIFFIYLAEFKAIDWIASEQSNKLGLSLPINSGSVRRQTAAAAADIDYWFAPALRESIFSLSLSHLDILAL